MYRAITLSATLASLVLLPACQLFDDTDKREGTESVEACAKRLSKWQKDAEDELSGGSAFVPTYTYDITKMALEDVQELIVEGSDELAGTRNMNSTNETSTAVANFMAESVDENGSFFMGRDPALYRVRGEPQTGIAVLSAGCERQKAGMRLIDISLVPGGSINLIKINENEKSN
ncbi:MAG: hypothetical protein AAF941_10445 [Pseudomonadota bacterium]